tara:strand:+ start:4080 stop:4838 length:759 start_codon:yes stop_codon:yes gene_type:complete
MSNKSNETKTCKTHGVNCDGACIDPNVDNGMMTKVWGPAGWLFLHCITFGYPYVINPNNETHKEKEKDYYNFFYYLGKVLPCRYCRESYMDFFNELDLVNNLKSRKQIVKWLYDMHNKVNRKLGVPECNIPSIKELEERYEQFRAKCKKTTEEERDANQKKGCVTPADGTPKRCVVKVVEFDKGDITRRDNITIGEMSGSSDDYFVFKKKNVYLVIILLIVLFIISSYFIGDMILCKCRPNKNNRSTKKLKN